MLFKISNSFFYTQKVANFVFPVLQSKQVILIHSTPTYLRCTADHHAVPLLNIRPVESGIIPNHFPTVWKTYPAHYNLSERARPIPTVF